MRITNLTGQKILCSVDRECFSLENGNSLQVENFEILKFSHEYKCFSSREAGNSKVLNFLSFFDDPFKLRREYHIVVDFEATKGQICDSQQILVTTEIDYVDVETRTYYEYFIIKCDGKPIAPNQTYILGSNEIKVDFEKNDKKLARWNLIWNVLIEPIAWNSIGYMAIYLLLSAWLRKTAWFIILSLIILNMLIELIIYIFRSKSNRPQMFSNYLDRHMIQEYCYK